MLTHDQENTQNNECWPRSIIFNYRELPKWACSLDQLIYPTALRLSEEERDWFWRFPICVGMPKTDSNDNVIRIVNKAYSELLSKPKYALEIISKHLTKYDPPEFIFDSWLETLQVIEVLADMHIECRWFSPIIIGEDKYYLEFKKKTEQTMAALDYLVDKLEDDGVSGNLGQDKKGGRKGDESERHQHKR